MKGVYSHKIPSDDWGDILILRPVPRNGDFWGVLAPLRDTEWASYIPVISGEDYSHALHGFVTPLVRSIGPHPHGLSKKVPQSMGYCGRYLDKTCILADKLICKPGPKTPDCYEGNHKDLTTAACIALVVRSWKEGRYVIVVSDGEFSL